MSEKEAQLRIELTQVGGVGQIFIKWLLEGDIMTLTNFNDNEKSLDKRLRSEEVKELEEMVDQLEQVQFRRNYGRGYVSDPMEIVLSIARREPPFMAKIRIVTDPMEPPPAEVSAIVRRLPQLIREAS